MQVQIPALGRQRQRKLKRKPKQPLEAGRRSYPVASVVRYIRCALVEAGDGALVQSCGPTRFAAV